MSPSVRTVLVGAARSRFEVTLDLLFVATLGVATFVAYAVGVFAVGGGVVFLPGQAAMVGTVGAGVLGYRGSGLLPSWLTVYGTMLAYSADHYLLGLPGRPLVERVAAALQPDGLAYFAVVALVLGTVGWAVGVLADLAATAVRAHTGRDES